MNEYLVGANDPVERIDKFVSSVFEEYSRTTVQKMIAADLLLVNKESVKPSYKVKVGDLIEFEELPLTELEVTPEDIKLDIVFEDEDVLVVNKPSGMVVHPAPGNYEHTLVNALLFHLNRSIGNDDLRPGIVHRIDKDTSGLLMVAKNDFAHQRLQAELKEKQTKREYVALVDGVILNDKGTIDAPIGRDPKDRKKMAVVTGGKPSVTHFQVLERYAEHTLISCRLETGRTHQIRVHMAYIKYPLAGDHIYNKKAEKSGFGQYLHAKVLGFTHPRSGQWQEFTNELPKEFSDLIANLRKN
ncbi:MAG: RluA family pseudouridine synthase [Bacilli bacterium]|nr:RluA family pseudouridine synthase [Bacilli bacterium]MBN2696166.1 RluA family pseudouridine synthase [Bacilli bacterium]